MKKAVIAVLVVAVLGGAAFALSQNKDENNGEGSRKSETTQSQSQTSETTVTTNNESNTVVTITYSNSGFSPQKLTVNAGTKIEVKNSSSGSLQFNSDPHPTHTDNDELNIDLVPAGESKTFTVTKKGTHGYHNHLNPSDSGTIIVE